MQPFKLKHLDHIVLRVQDMERSIAFYTQVLGCDLSRRREDLGMVHLRAGTAMIDLVDVQGPLGSKGGAAAATQGRNVDHFCLRIEPFDEPALIAHLHAAGLIVEPPEKRYGADGEGPSIYCYDPDGNQVELKGPAEG